MNIGFYDSSLTDDQWAVLEPMLPARKKRGRPPTDRRCIIDAILNVFKGGVQWRLLPSDFPPFKIFFRVFRKWVKNNTWGALNARLRCLFPEAANKRSRPYGGHFG